MIRPGLEGGKQYTATSPRNGAVSLMVVAFFTVAAVAMFATQRDYGAVSDVSNYFFGSVRQLAWLDRTLADADRRGIAKSCGSVGKFQYSSIQFPSRETFWNQAGKKS